MQEKIAKLFENLKRNNFTPLYFETAAAAVDYVREELKKGAVIMSGGSMTLKESGMEDLIKNADYNYCDRNKPGLSSIEVQKVYQNTIGADYYFCSANAITEKGEIVNVDGLGNRVSALAFGPQKVFVVAGINKIVKDLPAAFLRIKTVAAPKNTVRLGCNTPCAKIGKCVSLLDNDNPDFTDGCDSPQRICRDYVIMAKQKDPQRICVLLINEQLGY